jgi:hypothetical protein
MKDTKIIKDTILSYGACFSIDDIAFKSSQKYSSCYGVIRELLASRAIIVDHKEGKRVFFSVSSSSSSPSVSSSADPLLSSFAPKERFDYLRDLVDLVIDKGSPSLLVTGMSGIGKTFVVKRKFDHRDQIEGKDYLYVQGHSSPLGLYMILHDNRESVIVFDDCDSVFKDDISINILKCALDSYETRRISWHSSRLPEVLDPSFTFRGGIIFISNIDANRIDEAVKSRTITINLSMSRPELYDYMTEILEFIEPKVDIELKREVLEYLGSVKETLPQFNVRTLIKACRIRKLARKNNRENWKNLVRSVS